MSVPENVVPSLNKWIALVLSRVDEGVRSLRLNHPERAEAMLNRANSRFGTNHPDASTVNVSPVPIVVVANKYDIFKGYDSVHRKCLSQAIRFISHQNGACLVTGSSKDKAARDLYRTVARQQLFARPAVVGSSVDPNEVVQTWAKANSIGDGPIMVKPGYDSFDAILSNLPKGSVKSDFYSHNGAARDAGEKWKRVCENFVGKSTLDDVSGDKEGDEQYGDEDEGAGAGVLYPEPLVDEAREAADLRLLNYKKEIERQNEILRNVVKVEVGGGSKVKGERSNRK